MIKLNNFFLCYRCEDLKPLAFLSLAILSDEGPMLETLDYTIRIGSTPTFLCFDLYTQYIDSHFKNQNLESHHQYLAKRRPCTYCCSQCQHLGLGANSIRFGITIKCVQIRTIASSMHRLILLQGFKSSHL